MSVRAGASNPGRPGRVTHDPGKDGGGFLLSNPKILLRPAPAVYLLAHAGEVMS